MRDVTHFFTVKEIADFLQLNPLTVYEYIRAKKLPAVKLGRYYRVSRNDFSLFLEHQRVK